MNKNTSKPYKRMQKREGRAAAGDIFRDKSEKTHIQGLEGRKGADEGVKLQKPRREKTIS